MDSASCSDLEDLQLDSEPVRRDTGTSELQDTVEQEPDRRDTDKIRRKGATQIENGNYDLGFESV